MRRPTAPWISGLLALALLAAGCNSGGGSGEPEAESGDEEVEESTSSFSGTSSGGRVITAFSEFSDEALRPSLPGLTASHSVSVTLPADRAVVVMEPSIRGPLAGAVSALAGKDRQAILDAAAGLGIPAEAVTFSGRSTYGGTRVQANVPVQAVGTTGQQFADAVEKTLGRADATGVIFGLSDCGAPLAAVRRDAFQGAEAQARQLAESGALRLGPILSLSQQVTAGSASPYAVADPCNPSANDGPVVTLQPLDAPAEVRVTVGVTGTWSVGNPPGPPPARGELAALGRGSTTVKADEAYVVAILADEEEEGEVPSRRDRERLVDAIVRLGVDKDDIDIAIGSDYGPVTVLQVETRLSDLERRGEQVEKAVQEVLRRPDVTGVRFWHSDCGQLLAKARKQAVGDARARAAALAEAGAVRLGDLVSVSEVSGLPGSDPCDDAAAALLGSDDYAATVQPLDATPEFRVETGVRLGFALGT